MRRKRKKKLGMYAGRENTYVETKKEIRYVCRQGKHMRRKRKKKSGMCASRENTYVETKKRNQVCMSAGKTHA